MAKEPTDPWRPWRFVVWFGVVSLLADIVYEGARSVAGPYLASLGASAALIGVITGAGEAFALVGRLASGPLADRTRAYWPLAIGGYALTVVAVPLLSLSSVLGIAAALFIAERGGKALRSPAKDVMLSHATAVVGRGRGFAVHEALDQIGAVTGPLAVAAVIAATGNYAPAFAMLAVPGSAVLGLLLWLRHRVPDPSLYESGVVRLASRGTLRAHLTRPFWWYLGFTTATTAGYATFGVLSFHLVTHRLVPTAIVPVVYAGAMGVDAIAALAAGWAFDRWGRRVLVVVPVITLLVPVLGFAASAALALLGVLLWGVVTGVQESVMRAAVAGLVPSVHRGSAYGIFAVGFGAASFVGGALTGALYDVSIPVLIAVVSLVQVIALGILMVGWRMAADV